MTVFVKEMKFGLKALCIWTASIAFMFIVCIFLFPEMKNQMGDITDLFANMGGFTEAFGMDRLSFGNLMGFYGIECGNMLSIGGAFFAAFIGISALSKEEKDRTAEFLLTHPISRVSVILQKLFSVLTQILILNAVVLAVSLVSIAAIGEEADMKGLMLLHLAHLILQVEIACVCFGISAFIKGGSIGIGLGMAAVFYFLNIICNISEQAEFLQYVTPFAYADASTIIPDGALKTEFILIGLGIAAVFTAAGFIKYAKKDIAA